MSASLVNLVGDGFSGFGAAEPDVMTVSQFSRYLGEMKNSKQLMVLVGQGIPKQRLDPLIKQVAERGLDTCVKFILDRPLTPAEPRLSHKRFVHNVMLSTPTRSGTSDCFEAELLIDDQCAEMSDHVTGQHIQGAILIEAARQMFLIVTELFYLETAPGNGSYFVINRIDAQFLSFAFPIQTTVRYLVRELRTGPKGLQFEATVSFVQRQRVITEVQVAFGVYDSAQLCAKESTKARAALDSLSDEYRDESSVRNRHEIRGGSPTSTVVGGA